jgi:hypothetical protein
MLNTALLISIFLPVVLISIFIVLLRRKKHAYWGGVGMGLLSYVLIGLLGGVVLQNYVLSPITNPWLYTLMLSASITLLDLFARYASAHFLKSQDPVRTGLSVGLGQAAARSILMDVVKSASLFSFALLYTSSDFRADLAPPDFLAAAKAIMDTPWYIYIADALEYAGLFLFHMAISLYCVRGILEGKTKNTALGALYQFIVEVATALVMAGIAATKYIEYFVVLEAAIASAYYLYKTIKSHPGHADIEIVRLSRR